MVAFDNQEGASVVAYYSGQAKLGEKIRLARTRLQKASKGQRGVWAAGRAWTQADLAERVNLELRRQSGWTNEDVNRLERNHPSAKQLTGADLVAFASVLRVSTAWLKGVDESRAIVPWDALTDPTYADEFGRHVGEMQRGAKELVGWGEFLPCSLETEALMRAHHRAIFETLGDGLPGEFVSRALESYNQFGNARRRHLLEAPRSWAFYHYIFRRHLEALATGTWPYTNCQAELLRESLRNLRSLLENDALRIRLVVVEEDDVLRSALRAVDSLVCIDDRFAFWRDQSGSVWTSAHLPVVEKKRALLDRLLARASHSSLGDVLLLLKTMEVRVS